MDLARRFVACLAAAAGAGCVLVVDSANGAFSTTCGFAGTDTACGQCLRQSCQSSVDACCADAACAPSLGSLDACASGKCDALEADSNPAFSGVAACAMASCTGACDFTLPGPTSCTVNGASTGVVCGCAIAQGSSGNATACVAPKNGICCGSQGWPAGATSCVCVAPICSTYTNACVCETSTTNAPAFYVPSCTSAHCCEQTDGSCWCSVDACSSDAVEVSECTPANVTCGSEHRVARCSK